MKKIISILLTAVMLLSAFSFVSSADYQELPFTDVKNTAWYYEGIAFCYNNGIVNGMTETTFVPNGTLTRAQFVQILAMFAGAELEAYKGADSGFDDVKTNHWFNAPVCWAVEQGFVAGLSETKFGPNNAITREQLARLLYLFGESQGLDMTPRADLSVFTDESKVSSWAYEQVQWAVAASIISGTSDTTLSSRATATRAQACRMIMSYVDYMLYGIKDTSGAFAVIVDYIKRNGEYFPEESFYSYFMEYDGYELVMEYVESDETFSVTYLTEPYEFEEDGEIYTSYREQAFLYAYTLASSYDFMYMYENANGTDYMNTAGYLGLDSYDEFESALEGYENTELIDKASNAQKYIKEHIALILAEAGMTLEDFFLPEEEDMDRVMYDMFVDYICTNGIEDSENGVVDLIKEEGDKVYVAEYDFNNDALYFVYVSEPKAGGTDVFDTEYCEKAILELTYPLEDDEMFIYSYEREDGTRKINGTATTDGTQLLMGDFDYLGYDKLTAENKINRAFDEVMSYFTEVTNEAFGLEIVM